MVKTLDFQFSEVRRVSLGVIVVFGRVLLFRFNFMVFGGTGISGFCGFWVG